MESDDHKRPRNEIRPFFIAAIQHLEKEDRPCMISSEHVAGLRPVYKDYRPVGNRTKLLMSKGTIETSVSAPYSTVRAIFARHGYIFVDIQDLEAETENMKQNESHLRPNY